MQARLFIEDKNLEGLPATLQITLSVKEWRAIHKSIPKDKWPEWKFASLIRDAIHKISEATTVVAEGDVT